MASPAVDLALALALSLVPTLLFLGLCRGLERLRDDDLVNRWLAEPGSAPGESARLGPDGPAADSGATTCTCSECGTVNPDYALFCSRCLDRLS